MTRGEEQFEGLLSDYRSRRNLWGTLRITRRENYFLRKWELERERRTYFTYDNKSGRHRGDEETVGETFRRLSN